MQVGGSGSKMNQGVKVVMGTKMMHKEAKNEKGSKPKGAGRGVGTGWGGAGGGVGEGGGGRGCGGSVGEEGEKVM